MATVSIYLNFERETEEAFEFYKTVFGTEYVDGITRFGDMPATDEGPAVDEADNDLVMNVALPLMGGVVLMGTDAPESMGFNLNKGNNVYINLQPDTREEADTLFKGLSEGGKVEQEMTEEFWGYYGACTDKFGVQWMLNVDMK